MKHWHGIKNCAAAVILPEVLSGERQDWFEVTDNLTVATWNGKKIIYNLRSCTQAAKKRSLQVVYGSSDAEFINVIAAEELVDLLPQHVIGFTLQPFQF